ncbi:MAG: hypothetical protein LBQ30_03840 [Treponema sp.]|jgi:hypothetical protein|nr:hypothetical protein [Treponema sp.]
MIKKVLGMFLAIMVIHSCSSPLEQLPKKVRITANPTINLPLGDPLKGDDRLGEELKKALDINASSIGLEHLYDYVDPAASQDRKFLLYQVLVNQTIELEEYKQLLQVLPDEITGLPRTVSFKPYLPPGLPPVTLPTIIEIRIPPEGQSAQVKLTSDQVRKISGTNSGLSLLCSGSKTIPEYIKVTSKALNLEATRKKEDKQIFFGSALSFTGGDFTLEPDPATAQITIDLSITMGFKEILDTNDITIKPEFIFNWTEVELKPPSDLVRDLQGTYPPKDAGSIDLSTLKKAFFKGKLQFTEIPLYGYVNGPHEWFNENNITLKLEASYTASEGTASKTTVLHNGPIGTVSLPLVNPPKGSPYTPTIGLASLPTSVLSDLVGIFNDYPKQLTITYAIQIHQYSITPTMLNEDRLSFEAALGLVMPLQFTVGAADINLAEDLEGFTMPDFGKNDIFGRDRADASDQVFNSLKAIRLNMGLHNTLGLEGTITLYANKQIQEAMGDPLGIIPMQGTSRLELTREKLQEPANFPFSPAFAIRIPAHTELRIKRTLDDNPFSLKLSIQVAGTVMQEFDL